jgi:hypothetical protein
MAKTAALVVSVDHHRGSDEHRGEQPEYEGLRDAATGDASTLRRFLHHLDDYGIQDKVVPIVAPFERVSPLLEPHFDLAFIDAAHDFETVLRHGQLALTLLRRSNAPLVFHDYGGWSGVVAAVNELQRSLKTTLRVIPGTSLAVLRG